MGPGQDHLSSRLRISYDLLDSHEQQLFWDAAFFHLGRDADTVKYVWAGCARANLLMCALCLGVCLPVSYVLHSNNPRACGRNNTETASYVSAYSDISMSRLGFLTPETDLHTLASCCLVHVRSDNTVTMHDRLRDLAYSIERAKGDILQRSRWRIQDVVQANEKVQPACT